MKDVPYVTPEILKGIVGIVFLIVQIFVVTMFFVVRYHFRNFSHPNDRRAGTIVGIFGSVMALSIVVVGTVLFQILFVS